MNNRICKIYCYKINKKVIKTKGGFLTDCSYGSYMIWRLDKK